MTHVKLIDETSIQYPPKNKGSISNYNLNTEKLIEDGYKKFVPAQKEIGKAYKISYKETKNEIREIVEEIVPDLNQSLESAKQEKIAQNDRLRDEALNGGVVYKGLLFDSDTDQKVNLLAAISQMEENQEIEWFSMDNEGLNCSGEDLYNIGSLIVELHASCWAKNAQIKHAISSAKTVDELEGIDIGYTFEQQKG